MAPEMAAFAAALGFRFRAHAIGGDLTLNDEVTEFGWFAVDRLPADIIPQHVRRIHDAVPETGEVVMA